MECPICVEETSKTIACPSCNKEACFVCIENYIKNIKGDNIKCLFCNNVWTPLFLQKNFPLYMIFGQGVVRKHTEKIIFEKEKALLPATQLVVAQNKQKEALLEERHLLKQRLREINNELLGITKSRPKPVSDEPKLICGCPSNECRGFIINPGYSCGLCNIKICKMCHVTLDNDNNTKHVCKETDIESVKFLKKDTKPCPSCSAPSKKTEGCSQVWCLVCHKAWNWNTREIERGYVHATDYYNYMRANGLAIPQRRQNDQQDDNVDHQCGYIDFQIINDLPIVLGKLNKHIGEDKSQQLIAIFQKFGEYQYYIYERPSNQDLRIKYLLGSIDEMKWKALLLRREKEALLKQEIFNMITSFKNVLQDLITEFVQNARKNNLDKVDININSILGFHKIIKDEYAILAQSFMSKRKCPF